MKIAKYKIFCTNTHLTGIPLPFNKCYYLFYMINTAFWNSSTLYYKVPFSTNFTAFVSP